MLGGSRSGLDCKAVPCDAICDATGRLVLDAGTASSKPVVLKGLPPFMACEGSVKRDPPLDTAFACHEASCNAVRHMCMYFVSFSV
jgi:hypothetical protein